MRCSTGQVSVALVFEARDLAGPVEASRPIVAVHGIGQVESRLDQAVRDRGLRQSAALAAAMNRQIQTEKELRDESRKVMLSEIRTQKARALIYAQEIDRKGSVSC